MPVTINGTTGVAAPSGSASIPSYTGTAGTTNGMYFPTSTSLALTTNGTAAVTIDSSQNMGLGVTPSAWDSAIKAAQINNQGALWSISSSNPNITLSTNTRLVGSTYYYVNTGVATQYYQTSGQHQWFTAASGTANTAITFTQAMTLDASGNLGIGGAPSYKLDVYTSAAGTAIHATDSTNADFFLDFPSAGITRLTSQFGTAGVFTFANGTAKTERMRIDSSGNTMVGCGGATGAVYDTNGGSDVSFAYRLQASNGSAYGRVIMGNNNTTDQGLFATTVYNSSGNQVITTLIKGQASAATAGSETGYLTFHTKPSGASAYSNERMRINNSSVFINTTSTYQTNAQLQILGQGGTDEAPIGIKNSNNATTWQVGPDNNGNFLVFRANSGSGVYVTTAGTSWTGTSDERLKTDLVPIDNAITKINALRSVTGRFKNDPDDMRRSFLIAQDVQAVLPEAVDASNPNKLGLSYTDVIPLLVASIKELSAKVAALEAKVA